MTTPSSAAAPLKKGKKSKTSLRKTATSEMQRRCDTVQVPSDVSVPATASREQALWAALKHSLTSGNFIDTKFYAYSRRRASAGLVDTPLGIFTSSVAIRREAPHYFERLLSGGFSESQTAYLDIDQHSLENMSMSMVEYTYGSDSDLEDEEQQDHDEEDDSTEAEKREEVALSEKLQLGIDQEPADSDKLSETKIASSVSGSSITKSAELSTASRLGRVVYIKDFAFRTFQAFLFYVYTGEVEFLPLQSQNSRVSIGKALERVSPYGPPACSPKSMYRLAEKYEIQALKKLADADLKGKLSKNNILIEIFSEFTGRYPEILNSQVEYLHDNLDDSLQSALIQLIDAAILGQLPAVQASNVISAVLQKLMASRSPGRWQCPSCGSSSRSAEVADRIADLKTSLWK